MSFYRRVVLPRLIHCGMRQTLFLPYRQRLVASAHGRVLEIGFGSGLNVPLYANSPLLVGLDPSRVALTLARTAGANTKLHLELLEGTAEAIPLDSHSIDTIVTAWTLCSIDDVVRALFEIRRVLRPSGQLLFVEHGRSPNAHVARWQDRLTPVWKIIAGGCHLNRPVERLISDAGFRVERLTTHYMSGPKPMAFIYEGAARPL